MLLTQEVLAVDRQDDESIRSQPTMRLRRDLNQFLPRGLNECVERAHEGAVASVPGATGLVNVTLQERWYWWGLASAGCTKISGDAIRSAGRNRGP